MGLFGPPDVAKLKAKGDVPASSSARSWTPADATSLDELASRILAFEREYERRATPFEWCFTRTDLNRLLGRLAQRDATSLAPAA